MTKQYLIVEYISKWEIPDKYHGGINPGPYATRGYAQQALDCYIEKQTNNWEQDIGCVLAEREKQILVTRHQIVEVDWPSEGESV